MYNLEEKIDQIMKNKNKVKLLSKRDLNKLMRFMDGKKIYSMSVIEYIYEKSGYCYDSNIFNINDKFLVRVCNNPIWGDGEIKLLKYLLSKKIQIRFPKTRHAQFNLLKTSCKKGHIEMIKYLLSDDIINENKYKYTSINFTTQYDHAIRYACLNDKKEVIKYLLSDEIMERFPEAEIDMKYNYIIRSASEKGAIQIMRYLLSSEIVERFPKGDLSAFDNYALDWACRYGYLEVVELLLQNQNVIDKGLDEVIRVARYHEHYVIYDLLISVRNNGK